MKEIKEEKAVKYSTIFDEKFLSKIPVFYRYMVVTETSTIGEMYNDVRFSKSEEHYSNEYMQCTTLSSYSNIYLPEED
jgi:hypothetical protein